MDLREGTSMDANTNDYDPVPTAHNEFKCDMCEEVYHNADRKVILWGTPDQIICVECIAFVDGELEDEDG
jgi:hypothetical protein